MRTIRTILLLGLTLSNPGFAADEDGRVSGGRWPQPATAAALWDEAGQPLDARGPGALFRSAEAAAVDALIYALLQAREARDTARIRGGTVYAIGDHYSYSEIQRANPLTPHRIRYRFGPREVARFHAYPVYRDARANRANEQLSRVDRRSVSVTDPLHRPLYVLHPSLAIRAYRGEASERVEVTDLRHLESAPRFADN
jgi:hypothetical protein